MSDAASNGFSKTAYWVVYIDQQELERQKAIKMYNFEPDNRQPYQHPYCRTADHGILTNIFKSNDALREQAE